MKTLAGAAFVATMVVSACNQASQSPLSSDTGKRTNVPERGSPSIPPPGTGPDAKTPLGRADSTVDPKSPEEAANVVTKFASLLKTRRYAEAHRLWSGDPSSDASFAARFAGYRIEGAVVGDAGALEGAAGSIYVDVPLQLFFTSGGDTGSLSGTVTLRRVNDVPGSTDEQRRWHIVKTDLRPAD